MQAERQGSDETHSIPAPLDYRNGLVNWSTLRILLKESSMCLLSSPYVSGNFFSENEVEKILTFLRY
ncbi:hypothetical protein EON65_30560 [archaeon]|nr:MAG: hypothetical protein EON65_30560 [archaeon]